MEEFESEFWWILAKVYYDTQEKSFLCEDITQHRVVFDAMVEI